MQKSKSFFRDSTVESYLASMNQIAFEGAMLVPIVALDDGYAQFNMAMLLLKKNGEEVEAEIVESVMPAIAKSGRHLQKVIGGNTGLFGVVETGEEYSVNEYIHQPDDTRKQNYPVSALNLCLTHAALNQIGLQGEKVAIVTGLPLEEYMSGDEGSNLELIERKSENLKRPVYYVDREQPSTEVLYAGVYPEAIAGMMDYMMDAFGNLRNGVDPSFIRMGIDIGGNTTDLAIILPDNVVASKLTLEMGVKHVKDDLASKLKKRFKLDPDDQLLETALKTRVVSWFGGEEQDVSEEVNAAVQSVMNPVSARINEFKEKYPSLREIVGFGGGVALMEEVIKELNPSIIIPEKPEGANARGFLKCAMVFDFGPIMESVSKALQKNTEAANSN